MADFTVSEETRLTLDGLRAFVRAFTTTSTRHKRSASPTGRRRSCVVRSRAAC